MQRAEGIQSLQHNQVKRSLQHFAARLRHRDSPFDGLQEATLAPVDCQQVVFLYRRSDGEIVS
jgi:hypothetical protein